MAIEGDKPLAALESADSVRWPPVPALSMLHGNSPFTLRKLQIFWAVAHSGSLTRASKLLGVSQPSISQQLAGLEAALGTRLFERRANAMVLTQSGTALLGRAEQVLRSLQELEDGLGADGQMPRHTLRIGALASVARVLLPGALCELTAQLPGADFDLHETEPTEIMELLHARRINVGLLANESVADVGSGFQQVPILTDARVLVVPACLDLSQVRDPARDLSSEGQRILNQSIQFVFGNQHQRHVQDWHDRVVPGNRLVARVRSFELAAELVRAGLGVSIVPLMSVVQSGQLLPGLRAYRVDLQPRHLVAMMTSQYIRQEPYARFVAILRDHGQALALALPAPESMPPFIAQRADATAQ